MLIYFPRTLELMSIIRNLFRVTHVINWTQSRNGFKKCQNTYLILSWVHNSKTTYCNKRSKTCSVCDRQISSQNRPLLTVDICPRGTRQLRSRNLLVLFLLLCLMYEGPISAREQTFTLDYNCIKIKSKSKSLYVTQNEIMNKHVDFSLIFFYSKIIPF